MFEFTVLFMKVLLEEPSISIPISLLVAVLFAIVLFEADEPLM